MEDTKRPEKEKENNKKQKIKRIANKFFNSIPFIIFIGLLIFLKTFLFYYNTIAVTEPLPRDTIEGTLSFIVVIVCLLCVLPNRARLISALIVDGLISLLLFADNAYYIYSNSVLSVAQFTNLQYGEEILGTLPMILKLNQILYFIDIIFIIICLAKKWLKMEKKEKRTKILLFTKVLTGIIGIMVFVKVGTEYIEKSEEHTYNKDLQIRESTIFGYHIYDIENALNIKTKYRRYNEMEEVYENLKEKYEEEYGIDNYNLEGIAQGKNVIIIQLESVQEFVVNKKINDTEITPNLNRFLAENIEISNMNMQSYSTTADSEHSVITSIYPMENGMSFSKYYTNTYDDIFKMFSEAGYKTSYMHGNDAYFWNRGNVYGRMAVDDLALKDKFEEIEFINGYLSDETIYRQGVEKLANLEEPFFSFIVAASSHTPYELEGLQDRSKVTVDVGKYKGTYFGNYLESVNYADYAFGVFINLLKEKGLYDDTVILVYGDHNGMNMYNEEMIDFLQALDPNLNDVEIKLNYTRVLCGLKTPGVHIDSIDKVTNKLDIKPTLTYLAGIEDGFSLGTNMFKSKEFVALNNERIITKDYYFDEIWYEVETGQPLDWENLRDEVKELLNRYYNEMKEELEISNSVSVNNLLDER